MTTLNEELRKVLISLGADESEADAAAASVVSGEQVVTRADVAELRAKTDIAELRQPTRADLADVKAALGELRQPTRADLAEFKA